MGITEADELEHPHLQDWLWRESLYFNFHDASGRIGGMATIGVLPNQQRVEGFAVIFGDARQVLFYHVGEDLGGRAGLRAVPGIAFAVLTPLQQWGIEVKADFNRVDPHRIAQGLRVPQNPVRAHVRLTFDALGPVHEFPKRAFGQLTGDARHYQQNGRISGTVIVSGRTFTVAGYGFRDHSWGIRNLSSSDQLVALFAPLGPDLTVSGIWGVRGDQETAVGYVCQAGQNVPIDEITVTVESDPPARLPHAALAEISPSVGRRFNLHGGVQAVMPIFLNQGWDRLQWYECSAHFRCGQQTGYGVLEVARLIRGKAEPAPGD